MPRTTKTTSSSTTGAKAGTKGLTRAKNAPAPAAGAESEAVTDDVAGQGVAGDDRDGSGTGGNATTESHEPTAGGGTAGGRKTKPRTEAADGYEAAGASKTATRNDGNDADVAGGPDAAAGPDAKAGADAAAGPDAKAGAGDVAAGPDAAAGSKVVHATRSAPRASAVGKAAAKATARIRPADDPFLVAQRQLLLSERGNYVKQAEELKAQADSLALEHEPGDVQFDEEGGEGGTSNVDRELDLLLSAQARGAVEEIDRALVKIDVGTYGRCEQCGQEILEARLEALPHASLCVVCKAGGLSSRR